MKRLGAIIALEAEAASILEDARFAWRQAPGEAGAIGGAGGGILESGAFPLRLAICGVGKVFASWACARLAPDCDAICVIGTSGGLSSEPVGSFWLAGEFVEYDMEASGLWFEPGVTPFSGMRSPVISTLGQAARSLALEACAAAGIELSRQDPPPRVASGDQFIADPVKARELGRRTGAGLCDMESAAVAKLCALRAGLDFFALRAVSDNADRQAQRTWTEQVKLAAPLFDAFLYELARRLG